ncbi:MAG TPA: hypothetical protein DC049_07620 [Spirochaetia bacterium]|nr:hypothetical protein [Spirochaetia bacterium]
MITNRKNLYFAASVIFCTFFFTDFTNLPARELVKNPGFENGRENWEGWDADEEAVSGHAQSGSMALRLNGAAESRSVNQIVSVAENTAYIVSGYIKTESLTKTARFKVYFLDSTDKQIGKSSIVFGSTSGYADYEKKVYDILETPADTVKIKILCQVEPGASGTAYFDDISILEKKSADQEIKNIPKVQKETGTPSLPKTDAMVIEVSPRAAVYNTINRAVSAARQGCIIKIHPGVYPETVEINTENITLEAVDPRNPPELDGADIKFRMQEKEWKRVEGKIFKTRYTWPHQQPADKEYTDYNDGSFFLNLYEDGIFLRGSWLVHEKKEGGLYRTIEQLNPSNTPGLPWSLSIKPNLDRIPGRFLYKPQEGELYVWSAKDDDPGNHVYEIPVIETLIKINAAGVKIRNLVIKNSCYFAVAVNNAKNCIIEDCFFINNYRPLRVANSPNLTVKKTFIQRLGFWERFWYSHTKGSYLHGGGVHIEGGDNANCLFYSNVLCGYYGGLMPAESRNIKIYDNIFSYGISSLISSASEEGEYDLKIFRNIMHHCDQQAIGLNGLRTGNAWIYRNVVYRCGSLVKGMTPDSGRAHFYHNTCALMGQIVGHWYAEPINKKHIYKNNIFYSRYLTNAAGIDIADFFKTGKTSGEYAGWSYMPFTSGPDLDYNLYWKENDTPVFRLLKPVDRKFINFDEWRKEFDIEQHGLWADPGFAKNAEIKKIKIEELCLDKLSIADYRSVIKEGYEKLFCKYFNEIYNYFALSAASPAVNAGVILPKEWPDLTLVRDGKPDLGAIEASSR